MLISPATLPKASRLNEPACFFFGAAPDCDFLSAILSKIGRLLGFSGGKEMIKPFYQGKLDTFCAVYAVLNALRLLCGIRTLKGRDILNATLLSLSLRPAEFSAFLNQTTDYVALVDSLLEELAKPWHLEVIRPFESRGNVDRDFFWQTCQDWLGGQTSLECGKTFVFRFLRYLTPDKPPVNRHWTTVDRVSSDVIHLFDSSHEAEAILNIRSDGYATIEQDVCPERLLLISPSSVRFIRLLA